MNSWKTTVCGIISILSAVATLIAIPLLDADPLTVPNWTAAGAAIMAGVGLLLARDNDKTSLDVGAGKL